MSRHSIDPIQLNSVIAGGGQTIKIRNFQALIDIGYTHSKVTDNDDSVQETLTAEELQKRMLRLNLRADGIEVLQNYVQPLFKIEKVQRDINVLA